jgi:predicted benzoate:H+ symporter BenE
LVRQARRGSVILKGLTAVGATDAEAASGLMALSFVMGLVGVVLSLWSRMPISGAMAFAREAQGPRGM